MQSLLDRTEDGPMTRLTWFGGPEDGKTISVHTNPSKTLVSLEVKHLGADGEPIKSVKTYPIKGSKIMFSERI